MVDSRIKDLLNDVKEALDSKLKELQDSKQIIAEHGRSVRFVANTNLRETLISCDRERLYSVARSILERCASDISPREAAYKLIELSDTEKDSPDPYMGSIAKAVLATRSISDRFEYTGKSNRFTLYSKPELVCGFMIGDVKFNVVNYIDDCDYGIEYTLHGVEVSHRFEFGDNNTFILGAEKYDDKWVRIFTFNPYAMVFDTFYFNVWEYANELDSDYSISFKPIEFRRTVDTVIPIKNVFSSFNEVYAILSMLTNEKGIIPYSSIVLSEDKLRQVCSNINIISRGFVREFETRTNSVRFRHMSRFNTYLENGTIVTSDSDTKEYSVGFNSYKSYYDVVGDIAYILTNIIGSVWTLDIVDGFELIHSNKKIEHGYGDFVELHGEQVEHMRFVSGKLMMPSTLLVVNDSEGRTLSSTDVIEDMVEDILIKRINDEDVNEI